MFGCEGKPQATPLRWECGGAGFFDFTRTGGLEISLVGEEVDVTESEAPDDTGAWCKRRHIRSEAE